MKTSLVTVTYNRAKQLHRGIKTILNQSLLPDEIIIVDDGSSDNTKDVCVALNIEAFHKGTEIRYIYIDYPEPRISCIPRNLGIKSAKGDVIIFAESEALHVGNTIDQLLKKMEEFPNNTILASQVWTMGRRTWEKLSDEDFLHPARIINHPYAMLVNGNMQNTKAPDSDFAITGEKNCNAGVLFACQKQWVLDIGGFDESFEGHGWDDFDLFNRLALYGKGVKKVDDIIVIHQWHRKDYPYNIYLMADENGKKSEARVKTGEYRANIGKAWGLV